MKGNILTNAFITLLFLILCCAFQTTLWPAITTNIQPHIWVCVLTYLSLYRSPNVALVLLCLAALILKSFTLFPGSYLLLAIVFSHFILKQIKDRTFWKGISYYILCTVFATLLFGVLLSAIEAVGFGNSLSFSPMNWLISALLNIPFSIIIYRLFITIDKITSIPLPAETGYNQYV